MKSDHFSSQLSDAQWLTSPEAAPWLESVSTTPDRQLAQLTNLRRHLSPAQAALIVDTIALRRRASDKFPSAQHLFFTLKGLEQSTHGSIAAYKAQRFPAGGVVTDIGCGIGGDLLGLATRGPAWGIDRDPVTAHFALTNLHQVHPHDDHRVWQDEGSEKYLLDAAAWHVDPDRRVAERRISHPAAAEPSLETLQKWSRVNPHMAIKLAPGLTPDPNWWPNAEWEWIGHGRHCAQLVAWCGNLAKHPGKHVASVIDTRYPLQPLVGLPQASPLAAGMGEYVIEPHAAVLAAQLAGLLAKQISAERIDADGRYLTSSQPSVGALTRSFRVTDVVPFDRKRIRAILQSRGIGQVEVKGRHMDATANQLAQAFQNTRGSAATTLIVCRHRHKSVAIFADRVHESV
ncbi:MAG: class I SAM-dependent methyltransferase [Planctomycetota bacterium]|nr:class I SAM-dependent methyltransferase [Planctomycetota bacterium]MDA1179134.1 class I SAM-dependent methyltransferase [Planctomycetota bacterium]